MGYNAPNSLIDALEILVASDVKIIAGGTDFFPALADNEIVGDLLDVSRLAELRAITREEDGWRIGAAARWTEILSANLPACFDQLKLAAREVGSWQIQNSGTIAGNICNASPAADGIPPLLALNAQVEISSVRGVRIVPLQDFIIDVRKIDLRRDEIVSAILIPDVAPNAVSHFLKLGARQYLVISIVMVSAMVWCDEKKRISRAHIAVGSCSAVACRLPGLEAALIGKTYQDLSVKSQIWSKHLSPLSPLSDIRGSCTYRMDAAQELCQRTVLMALKKSGLC